MPVRPLLLLILFASLYLPRLSWAQSPAAECRTWQTCRDLALDAREQRDYQRFQDLAWAAVRLGPANDPALMYLLARAQALGGRPQDALVTLGRLIERGVAVEAATDVDFERARRLPGWPEVESSLARLAAATPTPPAPAAPATATATLPGPAAPTPAPSALAPSAPAVVPRPGTTPAPPVERPAAPPVERPAAPPPAVVPERPSAAATATPAVASALKIDRRPVDEVSRFSSARFEASGLAYDAVSGRFLLGDAGGQRVMVLGDGSNTVVDYALAVSAGFNDVTAFVIDTTRGDLWVASSAADGSKGAVHRLQLISGRAISMVESPPEWRDVDLVDLAIADPTTILALDRAGSRLVVSRTGAKALTELMPLQLVEASSLSTSDARTAYAAHREGIVRIDLQQRTATPVTAAAGIFLGGFERIRWHRNGLIGVQTLPDGTRQIVRLDMARGRVTAATVLDDTLPSNAGPALATLAGDDLYYLTQDASAGAQVNFVVRRVRLGQ